MIYKVKIGSKEITYNPLSVRRYTSSEWRAIYREIVKQKQPEIFEMKKDDTDYIDAFGALICLEEKYETLLALLPQEKFSYAGTYPKWVADEVDRNTLCKEIVQGDLKDMLNQAKSLDKLKEELNTYFELEG